MPSWKFSRYDLDPDKSAIAAGRDLDISHKHAREILKELKGKYIEEAKEYLEEVIKMKRSVPFKKHNKKGAHRSDLVGWHTGRYPVKAARVILKVLENLENNAAEKALDIKSCKIVHAAAHKGRKIQKIFYRAFGRSSPRINTLTHVELACEET